MSSAVPLGSPYKKYKSFKQFLSHQKYLFIQKFLLFEEKYDLKLKSIICFKYVIDIVFTGSVLWYAINGSLDFVRYGLISALFLYYLDKSTAIIGSNIFRKKE